MQGTAACPHQITDPLLPQADAVFDDATALDAAVHMLNSPPTVVEGLIGYVLFPRQPLAPWSLSWHADLDLREREGQEAQIL
jgi:hypothetical protein